MDGLLTAVSAAGGLVLGDGLEVLVERVGAKESLAPPWWSCAGCGRARDHGARIPLAGLGLRRRCPGCGERRPHGLRPVVLALVSAAVLGGLAARIGDDVVLAAYAVLALSLVAISAIDLERFIIPNRLVYPTLAVVAPLFVVASAVDDRWGSLARAAIAGAAAFVGFFAVHLAVPRGMGFGDVRLAGVIGLATGWLGLGHAFVAFFAAFLLGAVIGIGVMVASGGGRKTRIPFGPFMAAGAVVAVLWGNPVAHALFHHTSG
ncbi:MAG TPA: A24 family peptidase [Acidimicrobiales bacterium]|nr:A24 family peptidase [Acidimicrobiales bacterium]